MTGRRCWTSSAAALAVVAGVALGGCKNDEPTAPNHTVYFEGNVYDGSGQTMGIVLDKTQIGSISIEYREKLIRVDIDDSGRYATKDPLPTWQDYVVTIVADGFRPFVSHNPGFEVPASLANMKKGLADIATTQTFNFDAYLFPTSLMAPAMTITVATLDDLTGNPVLNKAAGTIRMRPTSQSGLQLGASDGTTGAPRASRHVWSNDNDLLTQTITKAVANGKVDFAAGELVYGVLYEVTIYDVDGYQPMVLSGTTGIVAGTVLSKTIQLTKVAHDPLRIVSSTAMDCTLPLPTATTPGAQIVLTFSENIEVLGTTYQEDVDNGLVVQATPLGACPLKSGFADPTKQERGTTVNVTGAMMTFSWNPSVGFVAGMGGAVCTLPMAITSLTYGGLGSIVVQPKGDPSRKTSLSTLLAQFSPTNPSTSLACPTHP
jgi:hypothetical protein